MADNILKGIIALETKGVPQAVAEVTRGVDAINNRFRTTTAAGQSFGRGLQQAQQQLTKTANSSNQATLALSNLSRVAQDAPYGFIGIANNLNPLLESFQRLKASTGSTGGALKALVQSLSGAGGIGLALGIASSLAVVFGDRLFGAGKKAEETKKKTDELKSSIDGIFSSTAKEATEVGSFVGILKNETETRERRLAAIKELQKIQPEIFAGLKLEGNAVVGLDAAYTSYLANLKNVISAKIIQARLEQKIEELLRLQGVAATQGEKNAAEFFKNIRKQQIDAAKSLSSEDANKLQLQFDIGAKKGASKEKQLQDDIESLFKNLSEFSKNIKVDLPTDSLSIKPKKIDVDVLDLSFLNVNLPDKSFTDKGVFAALFKDRIEAAAISGIKIPVKFKMVQGPSEKDDGFNAIMLQFKKEQENLKSFAGIVSETLTPVFQSFFSTIANGGNAFKAFATAAAQALTGLITKLATTAALSLIIGPLLGAGTSIGAAGSKFSDVFKFLSGFGGARAGGGPVQAGRTFLVGENGPELFTPGINGRIVPNNQLSNYSGGGFAGGMGGRVVFEISGNKLIGVLAAGNRSQGRLV